MLILSRKEGERIQIGEDVTLTVMSIKGNRIRIGIEAPAECRVMREEVLWADDLFEIEAEASLAACS